MVVLLYICEIHHRNEVNLGEECSARTFTPFSPAPATTLRESNCNELTGYSNRIVSGIPAVRISHILKFLRERCSLTKLAMTHPYCFVQAATHDVMFVKLEACDWACMTHESSMRLSGTHWHSEGQSNARSCVSCTYCPTSARWSHRCHWRVQNPRIGEPPQNPQTNPNHHPMMAGQALRTSLRWVRLSRCEHMWAGLMKGGVKWSREGPSSWHIGQCSYPIDESSCLMRHLPIHEMLSSWRPRGTYYTTYQACFFGVKRRDGLSMSTKRIHQHAFAPAARIHIVGVYNWVIPRIFVTHIVRGRGGQLISDSTKIPQPDLRVRPSC